MNWQQLHAKLPLGEPSFQHQVDEGNRDCSPNEKGYKIMVKSERVRVRVQPVEYFVNGYIDSYPSNKQKQ